MDYQYRFDHAKDAMDYKISADMILEDFRKFPNSVSKQEIVNFLKKVIINLDALGEHEKIFNIAKSAYRHGVPEATLFALNFEKVATMQDEKGYNLAMYSIITQNRLDFKHDQTTNYIVYKQITDPKTSVQQDNEGKNIAMHLTYNKNHEILLLMALENQNVCLQQNKDGNNLAMILAYRNKHSFSYKLAFSEAIKNPQTLLQKNKRGKNVATIIATTYETSNKKLFDKLCKVDGVKQQVEEYKESIKNSDNPIHQDELKKLENILSEKSFEDQLDR